MAIKSTQKTYPASLFKTSLLGTHSLGEKPTKPTVLLAPQDGSDQFHIKPQLWVLQE